MQAILVHGLAGKPDNHWFPWLRKELARHGIRSKALAMPHPFLPVKKEWVKVLRREVKDPSGLVLIGHSLGCPTILSYLEDYRGKKKFPLVVLVAGFGRHFFSPAVVKYQAQLLHWHERPLDFRRIRSKCEKFVCISSTNDPLVPYAEAVWLAEQLKADLVTEKKFHFMTVAGHGVNELPSALDAVVRNVVESKVCRQAKPAKKHSNKKI